MDPSQMMAELKVAKNRAAKLQERLKRNETRDAKSRALMEWFRQNRNRLDGVSARMRAAANALDALMDELERVQKIGESQPYEALAEANRRAQELVAERRTAALMKSGELPARRCEMSIYAERIADDDDSDRCPQPVRYIMRSRDGLPARFEVCGTCSKRSCFRNYTIQDIDLGDPTEHDHLRKVDGGTNADQAHTGEKT